MAGRRQNSKESCKHAEKEDGWVRLEMALRHPARRSKTNVPGHSLGGVGWSLKSDRDELVYKTEIDPQTQKTSLLGYRRGEGAGRRN